MRRWLPEARDPLYWVASFDEQTSRRQVGKRHTRHLRGELIGGDDGRKPEEAGGRGRPHAALIPTEEKRKKEQVGRKGLRL